MQALSEVLDSVLMCEQDGRGHEEAKAAQAGKGATTNAPLKKDRMLNPVQLEELRKMREMKLDIAKQVLPQLMPLAGEAEELNQGQDGRPNGWQMIENLPPAQLEQRRAMAGDFPPADGHPAEKGLDIGQSMLSDRRIIFEMDRIKALQRKLDSLVVDRGGEGTLSKDQAKTFLTEHYPPDKMASKQELSQGQANLLSLLYPKDQHHLRPRQKNMLEAAKQLSVEEQQQNGKEELEVTEYHVGRKQQLSAILDKIEKSQQAISKVAESFTINSAQKQTFLYLCLIECARQIARHSKTQAMLVVKIFHEYFSMAQHEIRNLAGEIHGYLRDIAKHTEALITKVKQEYHNSLSKDIDTVKLKQDFNKATQVMEIAVRNLYLEEARRLSAELKLDSFGQNLKLVFPHASEYLLEKNPDSQKYMEAEMKK